MVFLNLPWGIELWLGAYLMRWGTVIAINQFCVRQQVSHSTCDFRIRVQKLVKTNLSLRKYVSPWQYLHSCQRVSRQLEVLDFPIASLWRRSCCLLMAGPAAWPGPDVWVETARAVVCTSCDQIDAYIKTAARALVGATGRKWSNMEVSEW